MLLGRGRFTGDLTRPGMLHAAFVRSPYAAALVGAHRHLRRPAGARRGGRCSPRPTWATRTCWPCWSGTSSCRRQMPLLAGDQVRFVGEPVAMVVADDAYLAEDAAELVEVDWDPQPGRGGPGRRHRGRRAPRCTTSGNCLVDLLMFDDERLAADLRRGAGLVVSATFTSARVAALPLEGRACLAEWDDRDEQLVHARLHPGPAPGPVRRRPGAAASPERAVRVIAPDVGGGFGLKCVVGREEVAVAAAALRLRRPVRWIEDRQENLTASFHGHEQRYRVTRRVRRRRPDPRPGRGHRLRHRAPTRRSRSPARSSR